MVLAARDEPHLLEVALDARHAGAVLVEFTEPDLDGQLTSVALFLDECSAHVVRRLPLALRQRESEGVIQ